MSFNISPEILSPATSPTTSMPLLSPPAPQEQTTAPFPSPLPPDTTPDSAPPAIPPETSPEIPVVSVSPPPPATILPPPLPEIPPESVPSPVFASPPPYSPPAPESPSSLPESSPPSPESSSTPLPEYSPPPPESSSTPLPESSPPPVVPQTPVNTNSPPPKPAPIITPTLLPPAKPAVPSPNPPLPAESIPWPPPPDFDTSVAPALTSPPSPLSYSLPSPASSGRFPAAVQIEKPQQSLKVLPGFIGVCVVVVAVLVGVVACVVCCKRRRRRAKGKGLPQYYDHNKAPHLGPKDSFSPHASLQPPPIKTRPATNSGPVPNLAAQGTFTYGQLSTATNGFSESNLLGEGGFGCVYKGVVSGGKEVAVKRLSPGGGQGEREFRAEVDTISRIHHKHLVSLLGYCITGPERLLVYEFLPNDTLEFHLHGKQHHVMEWETRLKIAIGSAKGLSYLHEDCNPKIIHRDIKASNILLDLRFEAKVSDFGLAKSFSDSNTHISHISTRVVGTFGYLAPEYASSGKVTEKSDVYSYGVMLLELITGRPPISSIHQIGNQGLVEWARPLLLQATEHGDFDALIDPRLHRSYNAAEMSRMVACAAACVRHSAWLRPRMSQIVHTLEGHASVTDLHEGVTPGSSGSYSSLGSSYDARKYRNDLDRFYVAVTGREYGNDSVRSGSTSEYGLDPSVSSGEQTARRV